MIMPMHKRESLIYTVYDVFYNGFVDEYVIM